MQAASKDGSLSLVGSSLNRGTFALMANKKIADPQTGGTQDIALRTYLKGQGFEVETISKVVNYWSMNTDTMGVYGNYYLKRAIVELIGLGANQVDDAIYPFNISDADGKEIAEYLTKNYGQQP